MPATDASAGARQEADDAVAGQLTAGDGGQSAAGGQFAAGAAAGQPVVLDDDEQQIVELELNALLPALSGQRRAGYETLAAAVADGEVPPQSVVHLQSLLELALHTARARTLYKAEGEKILTGLYKRTPAGKALTGQMSDINSALRAVNGQELRSARVGMRTLGHFTVTLKTDDATLTLAVRPDGMNIDSVEVTDGTRSA